MKLIARELRLSYQHQLALRMTERLKCGKPVGSPKSGGRKAGTPNRVTGELRAAICALLDANAENMNIWLTIVAEGDPARGIPADPARALGLLARLAEFAVPKLARLDTAEQGDSEAAAVTNIQLKFVDAPPRPALP